MTEKLETEKIVNAIKNNEVYPVYQPIRHISENSGKFRKFEVLARLSIDGEIISPLKFINVAKNYNLYEYHYHQYRKFFY